MDYKKIRLASKLTIDSIVDGPGLRTVIWTQGCYHNCKGCHNPQTHDMHLGIEFDCDDIIKQIKDTHLQSGVTLSGGEPFLQSEALLYIVKNIKDMDLNIWAYSGYTYEELLNNSNHLDLLKEIDYLVDGKFIEELKDINLEFRGSKNQRIIDVQESLKRNITIEKSDDE